MAILTGDFISDVFYLCALLIAIPFALMFIWASIAAAFWSVIGIIKGGTILWKLLNETKAYDK